VLRGETRGGWSGGRGEREKWKIGIRGRYWRRRVGLQASVGEKGGGLLVEPGGTGAEVLDLTEMAALGGARETVAGGAEDTLALRQRGVAAVMGDN